MAVERGWSREPEQFQRWVFSWKLTCYVREEWAQWSDVPWQEAGSIILHQIHSNSVSEDARLLERAVTRGSFV